MCIDHDYVKMAVKPLTTKYCEGIGAFWQVWLLWNDRGKDPRELKMLSFDRWESIVMAAIGLFLVWCVGVRSNR
jgi:hypothetical protein